MPFHRGAAMPPSAEALMRSRYSAYVLGEAAYLRTSWHPDTLPRDFTLQDQARVQWLGLQVKQHEILDAQHARVEFVARYKINGKAQRLHEVSRFVREQGRWYYVDGTVENPPSPMKKNPAIAAGLNGGHSEKSD
jgi:SEC-C motif-containing protein